MQLVSDIRHRSPSETESDSLGGECGFGDRGQCPAAGRIQIFQEVLHNCVPMYSQEVLVLKSMVVEIIRRCRVLLRSEALCRPRLHGLSMRLVT